MHWTAIEPGVTESREPRVTNSLGMAIGMWGYTPVRITGVLFVIYFVCVPLSLIVMLCGCCVQQQSLVQQQQQQRDLQFQQAVAADQQRQFIGV